MAKDLCSPAEVLATHYGPDDSARVIATIFIDLGSPRRELEKLTLKNASCLLKYLFPSDRTSKDPEVQGILVRLTQAAVDMRLERIRMESPFLWFVGNLNLGQE